VQQSRPGASVGRDCDACRARPRHGGAAACRVGDGRTGGRGTSVPVARGCIRCNGSGRLPGQARDVTGKAEPGAALQLSRYRRCNDDAATATSSAASSLHQIQAAVKSLVTAGRPTPRHAERTAGPTRCGAGSACSPGLPNDAPDAILPFCQSCENVCRSGCRSGRPTAAPGLRSSDRRTRRRLTLGAEPQPGVGRVRYDRRAPGCAVSCPGRPWYRWAGPPSRQPLAVIRTTRDRRSMSDASGSPAL